MPTAPPFALSWAGLAVPHPGSAQLMAAASATAIGRAVLAIRMTRSPSRPANGRSVRRRQPTVTLFMVTVLVVVVLWAVTASPASSDAGRATVAVEPGMRVQVTPSGEV